MTDNLNPSPRPDDPTSALPTAVPTPEPVLSPAATVDWRDRVLGIRGVTAVALASVILGGAGGAVLGSVAGSSDDQSGRTGQMGQMVPPTTGQLPPALPQGQDATSSDDSVEG